MFTSVQEPCDESVIRSRLSSVPCSKLAGRWVLVATTLASSMAFIDGTVVNVALPALQTNLNATIVDVQWVIEAYSLLLSALLLVGGSLGDHYGRRRVFLIGIALFALASTRCGPARPRQSRYHQQFVCGKRTGTRDRHLVGFQRDHDCHGTGDRRLADRTSLLARHILH